MTKRPPRIRYKGDRNRAKRLRVIAIDQLDYLEWLRGFQNLYQDSYTQRLNDGSIIDYRFIGEDRYITIEAPPQIEEGRPSIPEERQEEYDYLMVACIMGNFTTSEYDIRVIIYDIQSRTLAFDVIKDDDAEEAVAGAVI